MNGSPLPTLLLQQAGAKCVSIGRVQIPTLYIAYQRDLAIKNFKPELYLEINAQVLAESQEFVAKIDPYKRFSDENQLITFMNDKSLGMGYRKV